MHGKTIIMKPATHRHKRWTFGLLLVAALTLALFAYAAESVSPAYDQSPQFRDGRFHNVVPRAERSFFEVGRNWADVMFNKPANARPDRELPVETLTRAELLAAPDNSVWRLGHSSLLFKLHDKFWLTDPVFAERASPLSWIGPKRFHKPPIALEDLPPLEAVIISHDHYDHLDHATIMALHGGVKRFVAPLGVGALLVEWGVAQDKVSELDWWDETRVDGIRVVATPAQHYSGRGLGSRDRTLWASWVIAGQDFNLFFSGDSGYFDGFKEIGKRFGPFDMAFIEAGAYDKRWEYVHMLPEQTVQAFADLKGKRLFTIHNGTFDLAMHAWNDPMQQVARLAAASRIELVMPAMGARSNFLMPSPTSSWW